MVSAESHRVALVTGSGRGLGRDIAVRLAQDGYTVVVHYHRDAEEAGKTLERILPLSPDSIRLRANLTIADEATDLLAEVHARFKRLDLLVNNVGPWLSKPLIDTTDDEWRLLVEGNFGSVFYCCRSALRIMRVQKEGVIVNIGALNSEVFPGGSPHSPVYGAAKAAVLMLTRSLARSEGPYNIRVNAINPGIMRTYAFEDAPQEWLDQSLADIALGRFGEGSDIAEAVSFLASAKAGYITGTILHVHGGIWIQE